MKISYNTREFVRKMFLCAVVQLAGWSGQVLNAGTLTDVDGDGIDDVGVYHWQTGNWYMRGSTEGAVGWNWGGPRSRPVIGDFDGDGKMDPAIYNQDTGEWIIFQTGSKTIRKEIFGGPGMFPVPADYDGDDKTDLALFERTTGRWIIRGSQPGPDRSFYFGWSLTRPVPADFDGDGKADPALYNRWNGMWYILGSKDGLRTRKFGHTGARPVVGDYDGDGKADIAVYDREGYWSILESSGGLRKIKWGFPAARPVPADYDGDGKTDIAVYQRNKAKWFIRQSQTHTASIFTYGWPMATPLQSYQNGGIDGGVVLCFGDSITYGRGSHHNGPPSGYPERLEKILSPALGGLFDVVNAGVPGETTSGGRSRFASVFQSIRPELVLLMEGTNDQFYFIPYSTTLQNIDAMVNYAEGQGANVILANVAPVRENGFPFSRSLQAARVRTLNGYLQNYASQRNLELAPVYQTLFHHPLWDRGVMAAGSANHPNDLGYQALSETFLRSIRKAIQTGRLY